MIYPFPLYNVTICDFCAEFNTVQHNVFRQCLQYSIKSEGIDYKRILTHNIIEHCCKIISSIKTGKIVFFYNKQCLKLLLTDFPTTVDIADKVITECIKHLPISWYNSSKPISYYIDLISKDQGTSFLLDVSNRSKFNYTFDRAQKYANKNGLNFLSSYFTDLKNKCLLVNT